MELVSLMREQREVERFLSEQGIDRSNKVNIYALNAAALTNKLLQYANGVIYDDKKQWHFIHDRKLDALEEVIESANGKPMLIAYHFKHDLHRILKRFKQAKQFENSLLADWNNGKVPLLVAHPASMGHGLNMQKGGHLITHYGLTWSSELYKQFNARLDRQGQTQSVTINRLIVRKTVDVDVLRAINKKIRGQDALMDAVKARIKKYADNF